MYQQPQQPQQPPTQGGFSAQDMVVVQAMNKSYTGAAIITFVAYIFFWLPGLIFNMMYLSEAQKNQKIAQRNLPGVWCLWVLLVFNLLPIVLCVLLMFGGLAAS